MIAPWSQQASEQKNKGMQTMMLSSTSPLLVWRPLHMLVGAILLVGPLQAASPASETDPPRRISERGRAFVQNYAPEDYGSHHQTWDVAQDTSGLLYVATSTGLVLYDGARWQQIPMGTAVTGARERIVRSLARGPNGRIYAGLIGSFGYFAPDSLGRPRYVSLMDKVPADQRDFNSVWSVTATSHSVFFLTEKRLFRWSREQITSWGAHIDEESSGSFFLSFAARGELYVQKRKSGLWRMERNGDASENVTLRPIPGGDVLAHTAVYSVLPYGRNGLLVGTAKKGLQVLKADGTHHPFAEAATSYLAKNGIYCGLRLSGNRYAYGTRRGGVIVVGEEGTVQTVYDRSDDGLRDNKVHSMMRDRQGGLWLTLDDGISRLDWDSSLTHFAEQDGLEGAVQQVLRHQGHLYASTSQALYRLFPAATPRENAHFEPIEGTQTMNFDLLSDGQTLLTATNEGVLAVRHGKAETVFQPDNGTVFTLHRSRVDSNSVYVGLIDGVALLEKPPHKEWTDARSTVVALNGTTRSIAQDSTGTLWLGTSGSGIVRFADGSPATFRKRMSRVARFDTADGLPALPDLFVYTLKGRVLAGTRGGLYRYEAAANRFVPDSSLGAQFAGAVQVAPVTAGTQQSVWIKAIPRAATSDLRIGENLYRLSPDSTGRYRAETPLARLSGTSIAGKGLYPEADGALWISGSDGLYRYAPNRVASSSSKGHHPDEASLIRHVTTINSDSLIFEGPGRPGTRPALTSRDNNLRLAYAATCFDAPTETRYRVRLDNLDETWSRWTHETKKDYTNLPAGDYVFRVRAQDAHGNITREARFSFSILPPWYDTWWAHLVYALLAIGAVLGLVRARSAHLEARADKLEKLVEERSDDVRQQRRQLRETNQELSHANAELREAAEQKSELLSITAHDLAAPLTSIKGFTQILISNADAESDQREPLEVIQKATENALQHVEDLRTSASLDGKETPLDLQRINLQKISHWIIKRFRPQADDKNQLLRFDSPEVSCWVEADNDKIREAMSNLVSNAIKYSPPGQPIDVRLERSNGKVYFTVEDRGPGLTDADHEDLFQPYQRLSATPTANEPSSGLGLYIVKKFIERHDGHVGVESEEGEGSLFYIALPAIEDEDQQGKEPPSNS